MAHGVGARNIAVHAELQMPVAHEQPAAGEEGSVLELANSDQAGWDTHERKKAPQQRKVTKPAPQSA